MTGLDEYTFTDSNLQGVVVKAVHLTELRAAIDEVRARLMLPAALYTRPIAAGSTTIAGTDILELRHGVE